MASQPSGTPETPGASVARETPVIDGSSGPLSVALSGGGTRAALVSGGVLLALHEEQDRVEVASIDAISGSSLLLNRLLAAGRSVDTPTGPEVGRERLLAELDSIWRSGFGNPFRAARLLITLVAAVAGAYAIDALTGPVDPSAATSLRWPRLVNWSLLSVPVLWVLALGAMTRADPVRLDRRRGRDRWRSFFSPRDDVRPDRSGVKAAGILPAADIWFGSAQVESHEMRWFSPYDRHPTSWFGGIAGPMQMALMSAAFPGLTPAIEVAGERYIDGGALDFLALERLTTQAADRSPNCPSAAGAPVVLSVDASVDKPLRPAPVPFAPGWSGALSLVLQIAVVIGAIRIGLALGVEEPTLSLLGILAFTVIGLRMILQVASSVVLGLGDELAVEMRSIPMLQQTQREFRIDRARAAGLRLEAIVLREAPDFASCLHPEHGVDLGTRLGPMERMVGVDLLRFGYRETKRLLGGSERSDTTDWFDDRRREAQPSAVARAARRTRRLIGAGFRRLLLGATPPTCTCGIGRSA